MEPVEPDASAPLRVLLVEDDDADAVLVTEHFTDADLAVDLQRAESLADAEAALHDPEAVDCVLLDLALPDAHGFEGLRRLLYTDGPAVLVLTGLRDEQLGADAVGVGAQDYLVKDLVDGPSLARAVRYAVERRRSASVQEWAAEAPSSGAPAQPALSVTIRRQRLTGTLAADRDMRRR